MPRRQTPQHSRTSQISRLAKLRDIEREWVDSHGKNFAGYIQRYGSCIEPDHTGDGGEAIFRADIAALREAQAKLDKAIEEAK